MPANLYPVLLRGGGAGMRMCVWVSLNLYPVLLRGGDGGTGVCGCHLTSIPCFYGEVLGARVCAGVT